MPTVSECSVRLLLPRSYNVPVVLPSVALSSLLSFVEIKLGSVSTNPALTIWSLVTRVRYPLRPQFGGVEGLGCRILRLMLLPTLRVRVPNRLEVSGRESGRRGLRGRVRRIRLRGGAEWSATEPGLGTTPRRGFLAKPAGDFRWCLILRSRL